MHAPRNNGILNIDPPQLLPSDFHLFRQNYFMEKYFVLLMMSVLKNIPNPSFYEKKFMNRTSFYKWRGYKRGDRWRLYNLNFLIFKIFVIFWLRLLIKI